MWKYPWGYKEGFVINEAVLKGQLLLFFLMLQFPDLRNHFL